jgi:hypothetical protein
MIDIINGRGILGVEEHNKLSSKHGKKNLKNCFYLHNLRGF